MGIPFLRFTIIDFSTMDEQIAKFRALRDSYRDANRAYYGEYLAALLEE